MREANIVDPDQMLQNEASDMGLHHLCWSVCPNTYSDSVSRQGKAPDNVLYLNYEGPAKSSVTNRLPKFYPRYILKCFTALEWSVEKLTTPVYFMQTAFQLTNYFKLK